jgi:hypothetical protein
VRWTDFSAAILVPANAPTKGQPLTSQEHYTRRFAFKHHLRTLEDSIGTGTKTNSDRPRISRERGNSLAVKTDQLLISFQKESLPSKVDEPDRA